MITKKRVLAGIGASLLFSVAAPTFASLAPFQTYNGNVALSTDGVGSTSSSGMTLTANIPAGSTVLAAYLYTAVFSDGGTPTTTLGGNAVTYGPSVPNATACCSLASYRSDITSIVQTAYDGVGGAYNFAYTEAQSNIDGSALVVVYQNATLPTATVAILDGFASVTGDVANINFSNPMNPADPAFFAEMRLGIGFSCCSQQSTVNVNGTLITSVAGNNDDGLGSISNGQLFTMGGDSDPFSTLLPTYENDHERYNLVPYVDAGDTTISINTANASQDDNIFLATFYVAGLAAVNEEPPPSTQVPEPFTLTLFGAGLLGLAVGRRRRK